MSSVHDRLVTIAVLLSDSAWLYAGFAVVGLAIGVGQSPLGWIAVTAILVTSYLVARGLQFIIMPTVMAYAIQMIAGVLVIYLTLGTQVVSGGQGLDLGWVGSLNSGPETEEYPLRAFMGGILGALIWWRGGRLASVESPVETLGFSFRLGIMVLAVAAVADIFHSADLNVFPLMFLFFGAGLVGLSMGHILPATRRAVEEMAWPRVIGGVVSAVLLIGLLFSLLQRGALTLLSGPALVLLHALGTVVFFVIIVPIAFVIFWLIRGIKAFFGAFASEGEAAQPENPPAQGFGETLSRLQQESSEGGWLDILVQVMEWTALALVILVVLFLLARAFRRRVRWRRIEPESMRESLAEDADPAYDMAKLLFNLFPKRLRQKSRSRAFKLPDDDPSVVDVFRVYFGLLVLAEEWGYPRSPTETPVEYQRTLEDIFPTNMVRTVTAAFNRACYGHHPAPRQQIDEMRASLERLASGWG